MPKLHFKENEEITIGVEIEIQLVDPTSGDLKATGPLILNALKSNPDANHIKSEIFQSMLEIDTPICRDAFQVGESLRKSLTIVRQEAQKHNTKIIMAGTHPSAHYAERLLTSSSRYHELVDRNQWITRRLQIFGLHVHLGMRNGEHAILMNNALCHYLPLLLAISASSPFWRSEDTGLASSRITFFEAIPTGGHPYLINSWGEFEALVDRLIFSRSITSIKDLWWDIRPNLEYGTIEIRIADCPPTLKEVEALVAVIHALSLFIDSEINLGRRFSAPPEWILRENKWRASRHGVKCDLIRDLMGTSVPFLEVWNDLVDSLRQRIASLNYGSFVDFLGKVIESGPSYYRQRQFFKDGIKAVIDHLDRENKNDQPEWSENGK